MKNWKMGFLPRIRYAMKPDEAYGLVLSWDNVVAVVSEENDMESIAHCFLSAAVRLDRKPSKCVVFEDDPSDITAAHNCTMMAVGLISVH
ncbi:BnaCnng62990D [Brassica napus]|uniref:BnaCnng62990D protein n=1 Tax=Brassica napus TaxID=3708 RepID=A0A078JP48_BRANA|nr:BnaCnng62990D [Brassica napus]